MKVSAFDPQHAPSLSVQKGWAATYDEMKSSNTMDYPLLDRIQSVAWGQLEAVADLACGTGRIIQVSPFRSTSPPVCWLGVSGRASGSSRKRVRSASTGSSVNAAKNRESVERAGNRSRSNKAMNGAANG